MRIVLVCKRLYTKRDLIDNRFGRLYHVPVQLARRGHEVHVIAFDYKPGRPRQQIGLEGVTFISIPANSVAAFSAMVPRLYSELSSAAPQVLIASGDIYIAALAATFARLRGAKWVFDVYDDYRYFASAKIPGVRSLFTILLSKADYVLTASQPLADRFGSLNQRLTVVQNGIDPSLFRPLDRAECRRGLGIAQEIPVIGYFGSLTRDRGLEILVQAFKKIQAHQPNALLLLAGYTPNPEALERPGIDYRGLVDQQDVPVMLSASDVAVIPYIRDPMIEATNACKIAEYLACEVPIVATRISDMEDLFSETPEILAEPGDAESLAAAITLQQKQRIIPPIPAGLDWESLTNTVDTALKQVAG